MMKMKELISNAKLVRAPEAAESISVWTDYCELQCLVADGQRIDQDQLGSIVLKADDFSKSSEIKLKNKKERLTTVFRDVYDHVNLRKKLLDDKYPFGIDRDGQLCIDSGVLTSLNKLYILLLYASNLGYMQSTSNLTSDFEVVSLLYMRKLFPSMTFKLFGSSNTNGFLQADDVINDVKLKDRIVSLSKFISVDYIDNVVNGLPSNNHGDGGLDLVGVRNMGDERISIPVIFGQCACSPEQWSIKQQTIGDSYWKKYLYTWETSFQRYIFIPIWYMNSEKQFENELKITECVVVDRLRLMNMADDSFITKCGSL